jgi:hypothetical protein
VIFSAVPVNCRWTPAESAPPFSEPGVVADQHPIRAAERGGRRPSGEHRGTFAMRMGTRLNAGILITIITTSDGLVRFPR